MTPDLLTTFETFLKDRCPTLGPVEEAMAYALSSGGKRLRPTLLLLSAKAAGADVQDVLPAALAVEAIHTYSLVHDDLPSMDDDDFRRGKPSCHKVFGEAVAILAGDALLTWGLGLLSDPDMVEALGAPRAVAALRCLTEAIGYRGMVGGQALDIRGEARFRLEEVNALKTAALFGASAELGVILAGKTPWQEPAKRFGLSLGLAFQAVDDLLDLGTEGTQKGNASELTEAALRHTKNAMEALWAFGPDGHPLVQFADSLLQRKH